MDLKELRKKSDEELVKLLKFNQEYSRDLRFRVSAKQYKDVRDLRLVKRDIARIKTIQKEKTLVNKFKTSNLIKK